MPDTKHECPYGGNVSPGPNWPCGLNGGLCHRCQQDRADRRTRAIVKAQLRDRLNYGQEASMVILQQEGLL